ERGRRGEGGTDQDEADRLEVSSSPSPPLSPSPAAEHDSLLLRALKSLFACVIRFSLAVPVPILLVTLGMVAVAALALTQRERDFLPPFNEGAVQLNVILEPGTSLKTSVEINQAVEDRLREIPDVVAFARRTGRAELDEHAIPVAVSEYILTLAEEPTRSREEILTDIREAMDEIPGIATTVEQPIAHLISHMLSGVRAQIAIKLYGDDLDVLRAKAEEIKASIAGVPGIADLIVEPQVIIPQLRIEVDRDKLATYGLTPDDVNEYVETAMNGEVVSQVLLGQRTFDLLVRLDEPYREDLQELERLAISLPDGGVVPLSEVANIYRSGGPNTISREQVRRRIVIQANATDRGLVDVVNDIKANVAQVDLPSGYFVEYGGQFESAEEATLLLGGLFAVSLVGIFLTLYTMFRSVNLSLQVMAALPMAFIGSVAAIVVTGQTLTVANMVGFIALGGIASRNGILLLNHYLHLVRYEGEGWTKEMIVRAGLERLAPVLMTALTAAIGLVPLALSAGEPGKEILYPVATVIIGGLISSTLLDFFVHPAMFWLFGMRSAAKVVADEENEIPLEEEGEAHAQRASAGGSEEPA
ncbi:MAG: efflux RND transporter permease subunit, partial [Planctomycetaceae bacterium]